MLLPSGRLAGLVLVCCAALTACGSTVQYQGQVGTGSQLDAGTNGFGGAGGATTGVATGPEAAGAGVGGTTGGSSTPLTTGSADPSGPSTVPTTPETGRITAGPPLKVGVIVVDKSDVDAASKTIGLNLAIGDNKAQAQAVINYLNARGGVLGRKLTPFYHSVKSSPMSPSESQAICDEFTSDKKVSAAISTYNDPPSLIACLTKRGVAYINDYVTSIDAATMAASHGLAFSPGSIVLDRAGLAMVEGLHRQGFLTGQTVGIIHYDKREATQVVQNIMVPRLKALGVTKVITNASSPSDGSTYNQSNAVLQFRQAGVTRVLAFADNPIFFMQAAESQKYYPAYGMDSNVSPGGFLQKTAPRAQLTNAHAVGVLPAADVDQANDPGPVSPAQTLCLQIMKKAGQDDKERLTQEYMGWTCDAFFFLDQAMRAVGSTKQSDLLRGSRALGASYRSAVTFGSDFSQRTDAASHYRDVLYVDACSCFRYSGPSRPLP